MTASHNLQATEWADLFELAPVSLWLEDYSALRRLFERWRAEGVTDLRDWLRSTPAHVAECSQCLRVLQVNRRTLELYGADSLAELVNNLPHVFRDDMFDAHVEELAALWEGKTRFSSLTANYTLSGQRLDIQLNATLLPGHEATWDRVLISRQRRDERSMRNRSRMQASSTRVASSSTRRSRWGGRLQQRQALLEEARDQGIADSASSRRAPGVRERCCKRSVWSTSTGKRSPCSRSDKDTLLKRLGEVFRDEMQSPFTEQLSTCGTARLPQRDVVNYTLTATSCTCTCSSRCCRGTSTIGAWCSSL